MLRFATAFVAAFLCLPAQAHDWYGSKRDPVLGFSCCGGNDCNVLKLDPGVMTATPEGYRIRLSLVQAREINPDAMQPIDALVKWDRVQPSETGDWHICIAMDMRLPPSHGIYCLFEPGNM